MLTIVCFGEISTTDGPKFYRGYNSRASSPCHTAGHVTIWSRDYTAWAATWERPSACLSGLSACEWRMCYATARFARSTEHTHTQPSYVGHSTSVSRRCRGKRCGGYIFLWNSQRHYNMKSALEKSPTFLLFQNICLKYMQFRKICNQLGDDPIRG